MERLVITTAKYHGANLPVNAHKEARTGANNLAVGCRRWYFSEMGKRGIAALLLFVFSLYVEGKSPTAAELLKKADDSRAPEGDFSFLVKISDYDGANLLRTHDYKVYCKGETFALIDTLSPARLKGRKILLRGEDLWLFLPSVKKPTRISLQQRLTGEVANGDIARTRFYDDYAAKLAGVQKVDGTPHYTLDLRAKKEGITYRRVRLWIDTKKHHLTKAEFYALSGKLLKTSFYSDYKPALGLARSSRVVIKDALAPNRQSHLQYSQYQREQLDESFFAKEALP